MCVRDFYINKNESESDTKDKVNDTGSYGNTPPRRIKKYGNIWFQNPENERYE